MKYCKKCGTLLEDTQDICIGCGIDVSLPENISMYPLEMRDKIELERRTNNKRRVLILTIIGISVLLLALVVTLVWYVSTFQGDLAPKEETEIEEVVEEPEPEPVQEEAPAEEPAPVEIPKVVKDDLGTYYNIGSVQDEAGNTIFTTVYPEDFPNVNSSIEYDKYSTRFPEVMTFVTSNESNLVQFTYISPQHFWYRNSKNGKTRNNERDVFNYMTYYTYNGVQPYLEALINASYTDLKKLEFVEKVPVSEENTAKLQAFADSRTSELSGDAGDFAKIGSDTEYAVMAAEAEASIYSYVGTSKQDNIIYMDFYVPVIANTLSYSTASNNDKGEVTEWVIPCIAAYESGNEELHEKYKEAFNAFIYNSKLNREFFYNNYQYGNYLSQCVTDGETAVALDAAKLSEYHGGYSDGADIGSFNTSLMEFLAGHPADLRDMHTEDNLLSYVATSGIVIGYVDRTANKLFFSPDNTEYPGEPYEWLIGSDEYFNPDYVPPAPEPVQEAPAEPAPAVTNEDSRISIGTVEMNGEQVIVDGETINVGEESVNWDGGADGYIPEEDLKFD